MGVLWAWLPIVSCFLWENELAIMNKILLMVFTSMATFANASEPEYDKTNIAAIIAKFEIDIHAIKDYSVLGKAQGVPIDESYQNPALVSKQ